MFRMVSSVVVTIFAISCGASRRIERDAGSNRDGDIDREFVPDADDHADVDIESDEDGYIDGDIRPEADMEIVCEGLVWIGDFEIHDRGDILVLSEYSSVTGWMTVESTYLSDLIGLECLNEAGFVDIMDNALLESLSGLDSLMSIENLLSITRNEVLTDLSQLSNVRSAGGLSILANASLRDLAGFDSLAILGASPSSINGNESLERLSGLDALTNVNANFEIMNNPRLSTLTGVENLTSISGTLRIEGDDSLRNLDGLESLESVRGSLSIENNDSLEDLEGLSSLSTVGSDVIIQNNRRLPTCQAERLVYQMLLAGWAGEATISGNDDLGVCSELPPCEPVCDEERECGPDPICGSESCGACEDLTLACDESGRCVDNPCPPEMVPIPGFSVGIDRWEASEGDEGTAISEVAVLPWIEATWYEAQLACEWAGKRLCEESEWLTACEGSDVWVYPYGDEYDPHRCNGPEHGVLARMRTGDMESCEGSLGGLFDMSGNLVEWTASCDDHGCRLRGGSYNPEVSRLRCRDLVLELPQDHRQEDIGFRCCLTL